MRKGVSQGAAAQGAFVAPAIARITKRRPELVPVVCGGDHVWCSRHAIVVSTRGRRQRASQAREQVMRLSRVLSIDNRNRGLVNLGFAGGLNVHVFF